MKHTLAALALLAAVGPASAQKITVAGGDKDSTNVVVSAPLPGREVHLRTWRIQVGRIPLYLLDANIPQNRPEDRAITAQLYGGDHHTRIQQEIILGIGGIRALRHDHALDHVAARHVHESIGDDKDVNRVALRHAIDLGLHRAGVGVDEDADGGRLIWRFHG